MARWGKRIGILLLVVVVLAVAYHYGKKKIVGVPPPAGALMDMRSYNTALQTYKSLYGHYPQSLAELGVAQSGPRSEHGAGLLGSRLVSGAAHSYRYTYSPTTAGYELRGDPENAESNVHLFTDQTAAIRTEANKPASAASPALQ